MNTKAIAIDLKAILTEATNLLLGAGLIYTIVVNALTTLV